MDTSHCPYCFSFTSKIPCSNCGWQTPQDNPPPALPLGRVLDGRYRIGRVLGHGGFGITYLAWDENLQLRLAIKEYLPRDCASRAADGVSLAIYAGQASEQFSYGLDRFLEEARALAHFDQHPGIVTVKNFFRAHGTGYCVMDFVEGITLSEYLGQQPDGRISFDAALKLLTPVMDALRAVHKEGLLHRDIAPDNIYLTQDGRIKLLDFGAARYAASEHSKSLSIILKPGYSPEEQYRTKGHQGPWTDVYGLAATIYRTITGKLPPESLDRLDTDELIPPSKLGIAIRPEQEAALLKGLAVKANQRFQSMVELQNAWRSGVQLPPLQERQSGIGKKPDLVGKNTSPRPPKKGSMGCGLSLAILGSVMILILFLSGIFSGMLSTRDTKPPMTLSDTPTAPPQLAQTVIVTNPQVPIQPTPENIDESISEGKNAFDRGDFGKAKIVFWPLAEAGNSVAQFYIGKMYSEGKGFAKDVATGVIWYRKAAEQGNARAQNNLGAMYMDGLGVIKDEAEAIRWYRKSAEQGFAVAKRNLGDVYFKGQGVAKDEAEGVRWYTEAFRLFRESADQGDAEAQFRLGLAYFFGEGVAIDKTEAARWLSKAAEQGNRDAQFRLGGAYFEGQGVPKDEAEAVRWFRKAAEQGLAQAQRILGSTYYYGHGVSKDEAEAVRWYRKAAEQGDAEGQNFLGMAYSNGEGVIMDTAEGARWYQKAAEQGDAWAQVNLGTAYLFGQGLTKNEAEAVRWFRKAAAQGDADGQFYLGMVYANGQGVAKNEEEAVRWYRKAADQGDVLAQVNLGDAYLNGRGVPIDQAVAVGWYRKAAEGGDTDAQLKLGDSYHQGRGVNVDEAKAAQWYRKAADQGNVKAQFNLGWAYENGEGIAKNKQEAVKWYRKAAEQGDADAKAALNRLGK